MSDNSSETRSSAGAWYVVTIITTEERLLHATDTESAEQRARGGYGLVLDGPSIAEPTVYSYGPIDRQDIREYLADNSLRVVPREYHDPLAEEETPS